MSHLYAYTAGMLVFGCRNSARDYLYHDEWESLQHKGLLNVIAAFSRDQVCGNKLRCMRAICRTCGGRCLPRLYFAQTIAFRSKVLFLSTLMS